MPRIKTRHAGCLLGVLLALPLAAQQRALNPGNPSTVEDFKAGDQNREVQQRATDLLQAMNASPGDWVADVGPGRGTMRCACPRLSVLKVKCLRRKSGTPRSGRWT